MCRHTFTTIALMETKNLSAVQASLGHTSSRMTEKYAKVVALLNRSTAEKTTKAFNLFGSSFKNHSENHSTGVIDKTLVISRSYKINSGG